MTVVKFRKPSPAEKHKGKTLCKSGFHAWQVVNSQPFDVKHGGLVTRYQCTRCGAVKTTAR